MINRLKNWWKNFEYWRWPSKKKNADVDNDGPLRRYLQGLRGIAKMEPVVREAQQSSHAFVEIDPVYTDEELKNSIKIIPDPCTCSSCTQGAELPPAQQGLHEVEIEEESDNRIKVEISVMIPPSFDHPLYNRYSQQKDQGKYEENRCVSCCH